MIGAFYDETNAAMDAVVDNADIAVRDEEVDAAHVAHAAHVVHVVHDAPVAHAVHDEEVDAEAY